MDDLAKRYRRGSLSGIIVTSAEILTRWIEVTVAAASARATDPFSGRASDPLGLQPPSPSAIESMVSRSLPAWPADATYVVMSPRIADLARWHGIRGPLLVAESMDDEGLLATICRTMRQSKSGR